MTLNAIAIWILGEEAAVGEDDAAPAQSLERGRSRRKSDDDGEIDDERDRERDGRGGG